MDRLRERSVLASVKIIQGPDKDRTFELHDGENVIGRQADPVVLTDGTVSRRHSRISSSGAEWILDDMGSANGTYLNGVKVKRSVSVHTGDQIRCGATLLIFTGSGDQTASVNMDENGSLVDAAIVATVPSNEDSVIIPTPEAGEKAIGTLRILYDLISKIGSIFNVDLLLQRTLDKIFEVVRADRGYIMLIDEPDRPRASKLSLRAHRRADDKPNQKVPISRTIITEVITKEVGVLSSNAMSDKRFTSGKSVHDFGIRSAVCVPIKGREGILGVIHVDCSVSDHTYSTEQLRLLTAIGYQTGLAVENVRLYEAAVQSERLTAVGETTAFLSHHIKNILQAMGGGIDIVEAGLRKESLQNVRDAWPIVQRNLGRINELILNMLAFSKARQPLLENININRAISEVIEMVSGRADERTVALMTDLDDMPAVPADADGLHQAFLNLVQNGLDAVEDRTGVVTVNSRYDSMNRQVVVSVIDNGRGIAADKLGQIFTPFFSAKGQGGTGLGLAVVKKIIEEHHGTIDVASTVGEGTTFTIKLPVMPAGLPGDTVGPAR
ncbi:MAG TPA: ATP-binding protein [Phycisphaerae bacterium]|nr:ATP-binding protein [Phycisphaerae bacterium]HUT60533.1 ATP-binding protein [Phycisphaerae bacterium]